MAVPIEVVRRILDWVLEFDRRDAMDRLAEIQASGAFASAWAHVMSDVRDNVPRYSVIVYTRRGNPLHLSVFSPDCNPVLWNDRSLGSSFLLFRRRALACGPSPVVFY
jgi:hypothetical protein